MTVADTEPHTARPERGEQAWALGEDLFSRLERWRAEPPIEAAAVEVSSDPLAPWARAYARGDRAALLRRLEWDRIDPALAAAALSHPGGPVAPSASQIERLHAFADEARRQAELLSGPDAAPITPAELCRTVENLWLAVGQRAAGGKPRGWSENAWQGWGAILGARLAAASRPTLQEVLAAEQAGAASPAATSQASDRLLRSGVFRLFADAPVLLRRSLRLLDDWIASTADLTARLRADRRALGAAFAAGQSLGTLTAVSGLGSDPHHGGREVVRLDFENGVSLAYKPRSVGLEHGLERLLSWMDREGCKPVPAVPRTLARAGYGWQEWIAAEGLDGEDAARDFYRHAGGWLAVAYALRAQDLHAGNVVASRRGPVVVDCEMFLQPEELVLAPDGGGPQHTGGFEATSGSCLASGLLTDPLLRPSAWAGVAGGLEFGPASAEAAANLPSLAGEALTPDRYPDEVIAGFTAVYRFLVDRRDDLLAPDGPLTALGGEDVRVLFRSSQHYADVLRLMAAPRYQRSGVGASLLLEGLLGVFASATERPTAWPLAAIEREALHRLDVPRFAVPAAARVLVTATGERIEGLCAASGLEAAGARIHSLDEADLKRQTRLLRRTLGRAASERTGSLRPPAGDPGAEALRLGRQLAQEIAADGLSTASLGLVNGAAGQALFLAALYAVDGDRSFARAAQQALAAVVEPTALATVPLEGGFTGLGSLVWGLTWSARLLQDEALLDAAVDLSQRFDPAAWAKSSALDVHDGLAGTLLAVLALHAERPSARLLELARACGDRLIAATRAPAGEGSDSAFPLAGFAHGASGIARALAALAAVEEGERYGAAALGILAAERPLFDAARRNWALQWSDPRSPHRRRMFWRVAWCHGAPGAGLARSYLVRSLGQSAFGDRLLAARSDIGEEIASAAATTHGAPDAVLDALCCGTWGRVSCLTGMGERLGHSDWQSAATELGAAALAEATRRGAWRIGGTAMATPGAEWSLLRGFSGIGYQLLALSSPGSLPCLLALELPGEVPRHASATPRKQP